MRQYPIYSLPWMLGSNLKFGEYFTNDDTETAGFIATNEKLREIYVVFRGSVAFKNWLYNLYVPLEAVPWKFHAQGLKNPALHEGFLISYQSIERELLRSLVKIQNRNPSFSIKVIGHSLGGALATICALRLRDVFSFAAHVSLLTFEAPRVGNHDFTRLIEVSFPDPLDRIRMTNGRDMVPRLPPYLMGFYHHAQEIFIPPGTKRDGTGLACDASSGEDPRCSNSYLAYSIEDHLVYPWGLYFGSPCED